MAKEREEALRRAGGEAGEESLKKFLKSPKFHSGLLYNKTGHQVLCFIKAPICNMSYIMSFNLLYHL